MQVTPKIQAVRQLMNRRFHAGIGKLCVALLDMLIFLCTENPSHALMQVPGFKSGRSHWVKDAERCRYHRVHWFRSVKSKMKFCIYSEPLDGWLEPFKVVLFADDQTGLLPSEVFGILEVMPAARLLLVELAFDFSPLSNVNESFVRRYGIFGKSRRDRVTKNPNGDWWGSKKGGKRVKSYFKDRIGGHRVEFRVRTRFLQAESIETVFDFWKFANVFPQKHIWFGRFDDTKLIKFLRTKHNIRNSLQIAKHVNAMDGDLDAQLTYLRQTVGLNNTRRLLIPLRANRLVRRALDEWVAQWPKIPTQLRRHKP
jgi:hypothetical protein